MLIPSIDIQGGEVVQLIGGKERALAAGTPDEVAARFGRLGPMAVIDLDAAMGTGSNRDAIAALCSRYRCRVGGGIRDEETARFWLDAGAEQIIIGTAARPEFLSRLPKERVCVALDAMNDEVVVEGWKTPTGKTIEAQMALLSPFVSSFLVTFVEREGRLGGTRLDRVPALKEAACGAKLTIAGGVTTSDEIRQLDRLGADAQVGMAIYTGELSLAEAFAAPLNSDREDGLWPTVVVDPYDRALGFCYSNVESLKASVETGEGTYWSRRRGLWRKGATSGATQEVLEISQDCDRDTLRFRVRQRGTGFCHEETASCWGPVRGLGTLAERIERRQIDAPEGSYTQRLFRDPALLRSKLCEEAGELADAQGVEETVWETADVLYFALTAMAAGGGTLEEVLQVLDLRSKRVSRRPGNAKVQGGVR